MVTDWSIRIDHGYIVDSNIPKEYWEDAILPNEIYYWRLFLLGGVTDEVIIDVKWDNIGSYVNGLIDVNCTGIAYTFGLVPDVPFVPFGAPSYPEKKLKTFLREPYKPTGLNIQNVVYINDQAGVSFNPIHQNAANYTLQSSEGITNCVWEASIGQVSGNGISATYHSPSEICDDYTCFDAIRVQAANTCGSSEFSDWKEFIYNEIQAPNGIEGYNECYNNKEYYWSIMDNGYNDQYHYQWYYVTHTGGQTAIGEDENEIWYQIPGNEGDNGTIKVKVYDEMRHYEWFSLDITNLGEEPTPNVSVEVGIFPDNVPPYTLNNRCNAIVSGGTEPFSYFWTPQNSENSSLMLVDVQNTDVVVSVTVTDANNKTASASHTIHVNHDLKATTMEIDDKLPIALDVIYPNPSDGSFNISSTLIDKYNRLMVYNTAGQLVLKKNLDGSGNQIEIEQKGVYFAIFLNYNNREIHKMIVQ